MPSLSWYTNRLRSMSLSEIAWRCRNKFRGVADHVLLGTRVRGAPLRSLRTSNSTEFEYGRTALVSDSVQQHSADSDYPDDWRQQLLDRAESLLAHRFDLFDRSGVFLGDEILWNYEPKAEKITPCGPSSKIDYRDYKETGDCKWVWEQNRHHHFVILGRAYSVTGDQRFAKEIVNQMLSWIAACPYGHGMNWRSPLEFGVRMINWAHAWELIRPSVVVPSDIEERVLPIVHRHLWEIQRNYSRFSSANNHLIGEAAGVFIGSCYFRGFKHSAKWRDAARAILEREIVNQTFEDGGNVEQATGYHLFVMEFLVYAWLVARNNGIEFSREYRDKLNGMLEFLSRMVEGGPLPMTGDADDGYVLDLGGNANRSHSLLSIGARILDRDPCEMNDPAGQEPAWWLWGSHSNADNKSQAVGRRRSLQSREFPTSGHYLLQYGSSETKDAISVVIDCGPLGFGPIAAHGHADALSVMLRVNGRDVLVDPGTYDYFTYSNWRDYFRSTRAHNTVEVDGQDQSVMQGPFLWGARATARCLKWAPTSGGGLFVGEHDGYARLADPVTHRRVVSLAGDKSLLIVRDEIEAKDMHKVTGHWHLAEHCQARLASEHVVEIDHGDGIVTLNLPVGFEIQIVRGQENPPLGWVSRSYHRKSPAFAIVASAKFKGAHAWETRIHCGSNRAEQSPAQEKKLVRKTVRTAVAS